MSFKPSDVAATAGSRAAEPRYRVLHPRGYQPETTRVPLAARTGDLNGKVVYVIHAWPANVPSGFEAVVAALGAGLQAKFPEIKLVDRYKDAAYSEDEPELWAETRREASAFIYVAADSAATTMWSVTWSAKLESMGVPGAVLHFAALAENAERTREKLGMPVRLVSVADQGSGVSEADVADQVARALIAPLAEAELICGVERAEPPPRFAAEGSLSEVQACFDAQHWTDGLPIVPPTEQAVAAMLECTSRAADEIVTRAMAPEGWPVTVEKVAINGVMAGAPPAAMPVLLAAVEAFSSGPFASGVRSTNSFAFMQLVNGPIAREIGMNSGTQALGPGNRANARSVVRCDCSSTISVVARTA
jgi:hypothetical protein